MSKPAVSKAKSAKRRREHPLFSSNPAVTSARQRLNPSPSTPSLPQPSPFTASPPSDTTPQPRPDTKTANGAATFSSSGSSCLDLFFSGLVRGCDSTRLIELLEASWSESPELTLQVLLHGRDCRGGKGERLVVHEALLWLRQHKPRTYLANLLSFLRVGYFKDLQEVAERAEKAGEPEMGQAGELIELELIAEFLRYDAEQLALVPLASATSRSTPTGPSTQKTLMEAEEGLGEEKKEGKEGEDEKDEKKEAKEREEKTPHPMISLAAKWAATEGSYFDRAPLHFARRLARLLFPSDRQPLARYRRLLSSLRQHLSVVERSMCAGEWEEIRFDAVPSKAHLLLRKAFARHQPERYAAYLADVKSGVKEVKSTGLQPHELTKQYRLQSVVDETVEAQWRAVVEGVRAAGGLCNAMAVVDVSGSMASGSAAVKPMDAAIALGLLVAQSATGPFADRVITFSQKPQWHRLPEDGTLLERVKSLATADWGMNTDIQAVFDLILTMAVQFNVPQAELPGTLFVFSDMEFDSACRGADVTTFELIRTKYSLAGYEMPRIVFWNLAGGGRRNAPVRMNEAGVALVSGFSGELLKLVTDGGEMSPLKLMIAAVSKYDVVVEEGER